MNLPNNRRSHFRNVLLYLCLLASCELGCARKGAEEAAPDPIVSVRVGRVEPRDFSDEVRVSGRWRSGGELIVAAPFAAYLDRLSARPGDVVQAGQRVAWLRTRESHAVLTGAERLLLEAKNSTERAEAARALELARRDLVRVPLKAPRDGIIIRRNVEPGAILSESAEILALTSESDIVFEARVPSGLASRLHRGLPAIVTSPGDLPRSAILERVLPTFGEGDQSALAWLKPAALRAPGPGLDRFGEARLLLGPAHRSLAVPDSAVVEDDVSGEKRVAVVSGGRAVWRTIHVGIRAGGWSELKESSLAPGAVVVLEGQHGMTDSSRVKLLP